MLVCAGASVFVCVCVYVCVCVCVCVGVGVCVRVRVCARARTPRALRIVSTDKILRFKNAFMIIII